MHKKNEGKKLMQKMKSSSSEGLGWMIKINLTFNKLNFVPHTNMMHAAPWKARIDMINFRSDQV